MLFIFFKVLKPNEKIEYNHQICPDKLLANLGGLPTMSHKPLYTGLSAANASPFEKHHFWRTCKRIRALPKGRLWKDLISTINISTCKEWGEGALKQTLVDNKNLKNLDLELRK